MKLWGRGLAVAVPAVGGYYAGGCASGSLGYAPVRSKDWVEAKLRAEPAFSNLKSGSSFTQLPESLHIAKLHNADGAVSESAVSFRANADPSHTVTFVHCGPLTVGFPFMVHGGVLGTLLRQAAELARADSGARLTIRYKQPTVVDQILRVETQRSSEGLDLFIYAASSNKLLVQASTQ